MPDDAVTMSTDHDTDGRAQSAKDKREQAAADLRWVLSTVQGRRVMARAMGLGGINDRLGGENASANQVFYRMGRRSLALDIASDIAQVDRGMYVQILQENTL